MKQYELLFLLLYLFVIPLLVFLFIRSLWRISKTPVQKHLAQVFGAILVSGLLWVLLGGNKWLADMKVRELCAKDGGIKVYEIVPLSEEIIDKRGIISIPNSRFMKEGDKYYYVSDHKYIRKGYINIMRHEYKIIRTSDKKVLGISVYYGRGGGDLPGPWHGSSFRCPSVIEGKSIEASIFVKGV